MNVPPATATIYSDASSIPDTLFKPVNFAPVFPLSRRQSLPQLQPRKNTHTGPISVHSTNPPRTTTVQALVTLDAVISTATSTTTVFTETIPTATTTLTLSVGTVAKRDATASPPKCMTNGVTYPASRITSACSCIDVPATTISATHTVSTETVTQVSLLLNRDIVLCKETMLI